MDSVRTNEPQRMGGPGGRRIAVGIGDNADESRRGPGGGGCGDWTRTDQRDRRAADRETSKAATRAKDQGRRPGQTTETSRQIKTDGEDAEEGECWGATGTMARSSNAEEPQDKASRYGDEAIAQGLHLLVVFRTPRTCAWTVIAMAGAVPSQPVFLRCQIASSPEASAVAQQPAQTHDASSPLIAWILPSRKNSLSMLTAAVHARDVVQAGKDISAIIGQAIDTARLACRSPEAQPTLQPALQLPDHKSLPPLPRPEGSVDERPPPSAIGTLPTTPATPAPSIIPKISQLKAGDASHVLSAWKNRRSTKQLDTVPKSTRRPVRADTTVLEPRRGPVTPRDAASKPPPPRQHTVLLDARVLSPGDSEDSLEDLSDCPPSTGPVGSIQADLTWRLGKCSHDRSFGQASTGRLNVPTTTHQRDPCQDQILQVLLVGQTFAGSAPESKPTQASRTPRTITRASRVRPERISEVPEEAPDDSGPRAESVAKKSGRSTVIRSFLPNHEEGTASANGEHAQIVEGPDEDDLEIYHFETIDDVDNVIKKYMAAIEAKERRLKNLPLLEASGEPDPPREPNSQDAGLDDNRDQEQASGETSVQESAEDIAANSASEEPNPSRAEPPDRIVQVIFHEGEYDREDMRDPDDQPLRIDINDHIVESYLKSIPGGPDGELHPLESRGDYPEIDPFSIRTSPAETSNGAASAAPNKTVTFSTEALQLHSSDALDESGGEGRSQVESTLNPDVSPWNQEQALAPDQPSPRDPVVVVAVAGPAEDEDPTSKRQSISRDSQTSEDSLSMVRKTMIVTSLKSIVANRKRQLRDAASMRPMKAHKSVFGTGEMPELPFGKLYMPDEFLANYQPRTHEPHRAAVGEENTKELPPEPDTRMESSGSLVSVILRICSATLADRPRHRSTHSDDIHKIFPHDYEQYPWDPEADYLARASSSDSLKHAPYYPTKGASRQPPRVAKLVIDGKTVPMEPLQIGHGSTSLGMNWVPAADRLALPVQFYQHTHSIPNSPSPKPSADANADPGMNIDGSEISDSPIVPDEQDDAEGLAVSDFHKEMDIYPADSEREPLEEQQPSMEVESVVDLSLPAHASSSGVRGQATSFAPWIGPEMLFAPTPWDSTTADAGKVHAHYEPVAPSGSPEAEAEGKAYAQSDAMDVEEAEDVVEPLSQDRDGFGNLVELDDMTAMSMVDDGAMSENDEFQVIREEDGGSASTPKPKHGESSGGSGPHSAPTVSIEFPTASVSRSSSRIQTHPIEPPSSRRTSHGLLAQHKSETSSGEARRKNSATTHSEPATKPPTPLQRTSSRRRPVSRQKSDLHHEPREDPISFYRRRKRSSASHPLRRLQASGSSEASSSRPVSAFTAEYESQGSSFVSSRQQSARYSASAEVASTEDSAKPDSVQDMAPEDETQPKEDAPETRVSTANTAKTANTSGTSAMRSSTNTATRASTANTAPRASTANTTTNRSSVADSGEPSDAISDIIDEHPAIRRPKWSPEENITIGRLANVYNANAGTVNPPNGATMYDIIHSVKRRSTLTLEEMARYPAINESSAMDDNELEDEINKLTGLIDMSSVPIPAYLRRRGILCSRRGDYDDALDDLSKSIQYDPFNSDAFWYRHQLYLKRNNVEYALKDLDSITENNKQHFAAFQTKARIYEEIARKSSSNSDGKAVGNFGAGENVYANEDFKMVRKLDPFNEHAIYNLAAYSFRRQLWDDSIVAFTKLLRLNPENGPAYAFRGRAYAALSKWDDALEDLTTAVQMAPDQADIFFHRGCLLRERNRRRAIDDFSISILLDDSHANAQAFYQRAVLYYKLGKYELAAADYTSVLDLDSTSSSAYLSLGLIQLKYFHDYGEALDCFIKAIQYDPVKLPAYLCRGDLYQMLYHKSLGEITDVMLIEKRIKRKMNMNFIDRAIKDYSRAIHLCPNNYLLYLYRGRLLLKMSHMKEATHDFRAAFELNSGIAQTFVQRKYQQIIDEFNIRCKIGNIDDPALYMLIAKAKVKCNDNEAWLAQDQGCICSGLQWLVLTLFFISGALQDLAKAAEYNRKEPQIYLQRGICYENLKDWASASQEFSKCLVLNPTYAKVWVRTSVPSTDRLHGMYGKRLLPPTDSLLDVQAYHHRGICKIHENNPRGVADLDRALKHDPQFFEAYLTRASYYHSKGPVRYGTHRYESDRKWACRRHEATSALWFLTHLWMAGDYNLSIDDCNEALKLEPTSIRAFLLRGACKCKLNQHSAGIQDFTRATQLDRACRFAFYNRAVTYQLLGAHESAIKDYSIVLLLFEDFNAYRNRGLIYWKQGDTENALQDLYAARNTFPQDARLHGLLALCLQKVGYIKESIEAFTSAMHVSPYMIEAYLGRGNVYASISETKLARRDYGRVIHMYPNCTAAIVNMAYTMQLEGKYKKAWQLFTMALTIDANCTSALEGRSVVHFTMKNYFGALLDICKAIEICPNKAEYLTNRGVIYQALNDKVSSLQNYKMAIKCDKEYALAYFNAANLYFNQRRWEQARDMYTEAIKLNKADVPAILNRGITYAMLKDFENSIKDLSLALKFAPNMPEIYFNRANVYQSMAEYQRAEDDYTRVLQLTPKDAISYLKRGESRGYLYRGLMAMEDFSYYFATDSDILVQADPSRPEKSASVVA
ncbi:uncharacterized protein BJ171DRAFT_632051 [Polychytrium aggregatum]|uniref:uncharacterized protein n=1 Tax=Polychytrium aggregatum TaxID=110093 RepID=UPI0022FEF95A|nr:uncharacterized protein BJ171DRAFT_632051 [Polychytrium aggregatum]KAI9199213.1 hypothetical protein BJ171DRAFT_632051 [Polychytrium aggregatum]